MSPRDLPPGPGAGGAPAGGAPDPAHPERALAADHALGLLDGAERAAYEAHLAGCAECRAECRAYGETAALLALAAPAADPPAALRTRILAEARRPRLVGDEGPRAAAAPAVPHVRPASGRPPSRAPSRAPWLAAAAAACVAAGLGASWARERDARRAAEADRAAQLAALRAELRARDSAARALGALVGALTDDGVRTARLAATGAPDPMRLAWNRRRGLVVVTAARLDPPGAGRVYQLWGIARGGRPQSLGVFRPGADGAVRAILAVPPDASMDVAAVTVEPDGGSLQPTAAPVMTGSFGAE